MQAELDEHTYETGRKVDDATFHALHIERYPFHGEGNYIIKPDSQTGKLFLRAALPSLKMLRRHSRRNRRGAKRTVSRKILRDDQQTGCASGASWPI